MTRLSLKYVCSIFALTLAVSAITAANAEATHFLGGKLTWVRDFTHPNPAEAKILITFEATWRTSFGWTPYPQVGAEVSPFYQITLTTAQNQSAVYDLRQRVVASNAPEDWFIGRYTFAVIYPLSAFPITALHENCCRSNELLEGNHDTSWRLQTVIDVTKGSRSPDSTLVPRIYLEQYINSTFQIPTTAYDGYTNIITFAPSQDSLLSMIRPIGTSFCSAVDGVANPSCVACMFTATGACSTGLRVSNTGLATWTPQMPGLYAVQFKIVGVDASGTQKTSMPLDALIMVRPSCPTCPRVTVTAPTSVTAQVGLPMSFNVVTTVTNPSDPGVRLSNTPLPAGASLSPVSSFLNAPMTSTFSWTPPLGATNTFVCFQGSDSIGSITSDGQTCTLITVIPNQAPGILCQASPPPVYPTSPSGIFYTPTAQMADAEGLPISVVETVDGVIVFSASGIANSVSQPYTAGVERTFSIGTHPVTFTVADNVGQTASCTVTVVVSKLPQAITFPPPAGAIAFGTAPQPLTATASSELPVIYQVIQGPGFIGSSGGNLTLSFNGLGLIEVRATQLGSAIYAPADPVVVQYHVVDLTPPVIAAHGLVSKEATGPNGAAVTYTRPSYTDNVSPSALATCLPVSGSTFAVGTSVVTCTATDAAGNSSTSTFNVTVADSTAPTIAVHPAVTANASGANGAQVPYALPTATDLVDGSVTVECTPAPGSQFPLGSTTVHCSAQDAHHNTRTSTFTVTVNDTTGPVIAPHVNEFAEATSPTGGVATYAPPSATDAVEGAVAVSCAPSSGAFLPLGPSLVNCSSQDSAGNPSSSNFTITVRDTTAPAIDAHATVNGFATGASGGTVEYTSPSAHDLVSGDVAVQCAPATGSIFPLGDSLVSCHAADAAGNNATSSFTVHVADATPPSIAAHQNEVGEASGPNGALVMFDVPAATDAVDGTVPVACVPSSGSLFPRGSTTVTCSAADNAGNNASTMFSVMVADHTPPSIAAHNTEPATEATGPNGAAVSYASPAATDAVDGTVSVTCLPASGANFALGSTVVECASTDAAGNTATSTFSVIVADTTGPALAPHQDETAVASSAAGVGVSYLLPTAQDLVDGAVPVSCAPVSGSVFAPGTSLVTCTASDTRGNSSSSSFSVRVSDTTPPAIGAHANEQAEATGPNGAAVSFAAPLASDAVDGAVSVNCAPASGSIFPLGSSAVTCSAHDAAGNAASSSFNVVVVDTTAPIVTYSGNAGTYSIADTINITCAATDAVGVVSTTCATISGPAYSFAPSNSRSATGTDAAGNIGSATTAFTVTATMTSLQQLVSQFTNNAGVAGGLNAKLIAAANAPNANARRGQLGAFENQVRAQTGKALTAPQAALLLQLVQQFY